MKKPSQIYAHKFLKFLFICSIALPVYADPKVINLKTILPYIEVADNFSSRRRGLMFRSSLQSNTGMLFIWEDYAIRCMWMKNTKIPLSIAFMSKEKEILEIYDMVPMSEASTCSNNKAAFALEVNKGWFEEHNITSGHILDF
jgi:uncharacterized membrane protein (UPF0127 family)